MSLPPNPSEPQGHSPADMPPPPPAGNGFVPLSPGANGQPNQPGQSGQPAAPAYPPPAYGQPAYGQPAAPSQGGQPGQNGTMPYAQTAYGQAAPGGQPNQNGTMPYAQTAYGQAAPGGQPNQNGTMPYAQTAYGQQPAYGQPYYPPAGGSKPDSPLVQALKAFFPTFLDIHRAKTLEALQRNAALKNWWWVTALLFSLAVGLSFSVNVARSPHIMASFSPFGNPMPYWVLTFGYWFLCFFVFTILTFLIVLVRVLLVMATAGVQHAKFGFVPAASTVSTGLVLPTLVLGVMLVIELLPLPFITPLLVWLLMIFFSGGMFMLELVISTSLRAIPGNTRSDVLWHGVFYTLWIVFATLIVVFGFIPTSTSATFNSGKEIMGSQIEHGVNDLLGNLFQPRY
ncbi:adhesin [Mobiluncus mulieris]|uniref:Adhesin n=1 Tax=Mobiluncus mulieris TaxID=2052 RepID=A0A848RGR4_9ACTO|nr:adhesin [Mobiluncus mulieris]MCU9969795.1 adhesin [Mobiluncus mulieris]MCU9974175.1 adhesin [Mobiluncus mulieris]MCV0010320.1 adhesin [Mobiluncus mulieris]NMW93080.1 adhesin [Mobiluncus mulieris]